MNKSKFIPPLVFFILLLVSHVSRVMAQPLTADAIGVAALVRGSVQAAKSGESARNLQNGTPIFLGDEITTDAGGLVQILLRDETVFTLGPNSSIIMDEFIYDPANATGKVGAEVVKGVFRFVSGKVARKDPKDMNVKLPAGNIGIRGTIVGGKVEGERSQLILLGPGENNNTAARMGRIEVSNQIQDKVSKVVVERTGFGTTIEAQGVAPTEPAQVPVDEIQSLKDVLEMDWMPQQAEDMTPEVGEESASEETGQDTFNDLSHQSEVEGISQVSSDADTFVNQAGQDTARTEVIHNDDIYCGC